MKYLLFTLLTTFLISDISAQELAYSNSINSERNAVESSNMQYFSGLLDDLYHVRIHLDCDRGACTGVLIYTESDTQLQLNGIKIGDQLLLKELDSQSEVSGFIKATLKSDGIKGEWSNYDGSIGSQLQLQAVEQKEAIHSFKNDRWVKTFKGIVAWDEVEMVLHHLGHQHITGSIYNAAKDEENVVLGQINEDGNLQLSIQNTAGLEVGTLVGKNIDDKNFRAEFKDDKNERSYASFELADEISIGYVEYANYMMNYEILFPEYAHNTFNLWVKSYLQDWIADCRSKTQLSNKKTFLKPIDRASERGYIWFDIEESQPSFVSGHFFYSTTWNEQPIGKSLNFDFASNKLIEWKDIFKKGKKIEFNDFKKKYIEKEIRRNPQFMDSNFRTWVKTQEFPLFTIQQNGIQFSTAYDEIFGQTKVTISYEELKPFMKKKNPINRLF